MKAYRHDGNATWVVKVRMGDHVGADGRCTMSGGDVWTKLLLTLSRWWVKDVRHPRLARTSQSRRSMSADSCAATLSDRFAGSTCPSPCSTGSALEARSGTDNTAGYCGWCERDGQLRQGTFECARCGAWCCNRHVRVIRIGLRPDRRRLSGLLCPNCQNRVDPDRTPEAEH